MDFVCDKRKVIYVQYLVAVDSGRIMNVQPSSTFSTIHCLELDLGNDLVEMFALDGSDLGLESGRLAGTV